MSPNESLPNSFFQGLAPQGPVETVLVHMIAFTGQAILSLATSGDASADLGKLLKLDAAFHRNLRTLERKRQADAKAAEAEAKVANAAAQVTHAASLAWDKAQAAARREAKAREAIPDWAGGPDFEPLPVGDTPTPGQIRRARLAASALSQQEPNSATPAAPAS